MWLMKYDDWQILRDTDRYMGDYFDKEDPADWVTRQGSFYEKEREMHAQLKERYTRFIVRTHRSEVVRAYPGRRAPQAAEPEVEEFQSAGSQHEEEEHGEEREPQYSPTEELCSPTEPAESEGEGGSRGAGIEGDLQSAV